MPALPRMSLETREEQVGYLRTCLRADEADITTTDREVVRHMLRHVFTVEAEFAPLGGEPIVARVHSLEMLRALATSPLRLVHITYTYNVKGVL